MSHPSSEVFADEMPHAAGRAGRLARLTRKELRETLRDRRTLITLVLMPFLLYPLLSLILQKFLVAGMIAGTAPSYHVGFFNEQDATFVSTIITTSRAVMATRRPDEQVPDLRMFSSPNVEDHLKVGDVDVVVRVTKHIPADYQPENSWEVDCELITVTGSTTGERAAQYVEDCLRVYGTGVIAQRLQMANVRQRANPFRIMDRKLDNPSSGAVSLTAVIPFVLVLMTITGAVYPAIDLTAGERERGTLELLVAAPVPRLSLLFAKYIAVVTVSMLTAVINLIAMTGTVVVSGLGPMLWGERGLPPSTIFAVLCLLLLLASFFSALLLAITSFARSFKEAQAYLIPVMLCALGPGLISLMPGVRLNGWLVVTPLLNVALLARDALQGEVPVVTGAIVVASTALYAFASLAIAAKLFAADAVLYDARIGWSELWRRPAHSVSAGTALALLCLACMFPVSFAATGGIATLSELGIAGKLAAMAVTTGIVFGGVPLLFAYWRRIPFDTGFQWRIPSLSSWLGAILLGCSLWPFAHEIVLFTQELGLVSLEPEQFARARDLMEQCRTVPVWLVLLAFAIAPAIFEEFCFRGFVFSALKSRFKPRGAILLSGLLFGIFHLVATDALAIERLLPSTFVGIILGWVCHRTGSVFPGMVLHAFHNGSLALLFYYLPEIQRRGWGVEERSHLPWTWLAAAAACAVVGGVLIAVSRRALSDPSSALTSRPS